VDNKISNPSFSSLSQYRNCQLLYKYGNHLGLVPRGAATNHDLLYGSAGHAALAALYNNEPIRAVGETFMNAYPAGLYPDPLPKYGQGKSQANFLAALWRYINDIWRVDCENWEVLSVERPESTEGLGEYDHLLVLDLVVRDKQDGLVWGIDHKITGSYLSDIWPRYELSSQVRMYTADIKRRYGNCGGFIINAISLRHRSKAYTPRTGADKGKQLPAGDWFAFGRMVYRPNEECLKLEQANVQATTDAMRDSIQRDVWSYNTARCHIGKDYACPFVTICQPGWSWPQDRESILEYYRQRCGQRIIATGATIGHCELNREHDGECSPNAPEESPLPQIIVVPENDPYFASIED